VVAHEVGARLLQLWGPQLAATEANAAAKQVVDTLARATREAPAVVLLGDVEAVAPREGGGPLLPVLLTAVRELVAAGRAAVVCTTAHPSRSPRSCARPARSTTSWPCRCPTAASACGCWRSPPAASRSPTTSTSTRWRGAPGLRGGRRAGAGARGRPAGSCPPARQRRPDARRGRPRGGAGGRPGDVHGGLDARPVAAHPRRRRRHGRGQGLAHRGGAVAAGLPRHLRPPRRRPAARACCCTARPAAARRSSSRRSPARARPTCCR
jgi:hypothetical protein